MVKMSLFLVGLLIFTFLSVQPVNAGTSPKAEHSYVEDISSDLVLNPEFIETGEGVEVQDNAPKMFIFEALQPWLGHDASDLYFKKYKARKSVEMEGPKPENIRLWIKDIKSDDRKYTHVITVFLPYENVIVDGEKQTRSADTFVYAVNAIQLPVCHGSDEMKNCVKLINSYHKVVNPK